MDLAARVTLLEEEVSVLKGEIKSILLEVRTAVLARENPLVQIAPELSLVPDQPRAWS